VSTSDDLQAQYEGYYADGSVDKKRAIAAKQSVGHIKALIGDRKFQSILDIGAGEGAVLQELQAQQLGDVLSAVEISGSGLDAIKRRTIANLKDVGRFDGYKIPHPDRSFDLGLAIHVLEHVEHERMFLAEAARVCKTLYVEVPLEHIGDLQRSIRNSGPFGHINFYTRHSFANLLTTTGLKIEGMTVFPHDLAYEQLGSGQMKGALKYYIRRGMLNIAPKIAMRNLVYMAGALCSK
jgi:SAM-dependent methyltransferase